ncbi:hypothetical protein DENSPDRAFT_532243 [Dentipellis sp. KUC8613]|nr:hypothetical protein DENSPDRAFT_532243 [Dentipellis sp. KUC8613]
MQPQATGYSSPPHSDFSAPPSAIHATLSDTDLSEAPSQPVESLAGSTDYSQSVGLSEVPHKRGVPLVCSFASAASSYRLSMSSSLYRPTSLFPLVPPRPFASLPGAPFYTLGTRAAASFPSEPRPALSFSPSTPALPPSSVPSAATTFWDLPSTNSASSFVLSTETVVPWSDAPQQPTTPAAAYGPQYGTRIPSVRDIQSAHHFSHLHTSSLDNPQENHLSLFPAREDTPRNWQNFTQASGVMPSLQPPNYLPQRIPLIPRPRSGRTQGGISCSGYTADVRSSCRNCRQHNASESMQ